MKVKIYCPDIECDSCIRVLDKRFKGIQGIEDFEIKEEYLLIEYDESLVKIDNIMSVIKNAGFRASTEPFERKSFKERLRHFKENKSHYLIESTAIKYAFWIFIMLTVVETIAYFGILKTIPNFINNYAIWFFHTNLTVASVGGAMWHLYSYKIKVTCMMGMMIGMTIGMQTGMLIGAILGATNGFFIGALVGMLISVTVGAITGKCCGIMGIMEGMMAGVMGGTMGPMITVMMFTDHLHWLMPFYIIINLIITWGLIYLVFEESVEGKKHEKQPVDFSLFASICFLVTTILVLIMLYGPKNPFMFS